jgi:hypothetical protein
LNLKNYNYNLNFKFLKDGELWRAMFFQSTFVTSLNQSKISVSATEFGVEWIMDLGSAKKPVMDVTRAMETR